MSKSNVRKHARSKKMARKTLKRMLADAAEAKLVERIAKMHALEYSPAGPSRDLVSPITHALVKAPKLVESEYEANDTGSPIITSEMVAKAVVIEPFCVTCQKSFKTSAGLKTHERSKAHLALIESAKEPA